MAARFSLGQWFLIGGALLALLGLILWLTLPITLRFPPYVATALLAVANGALCLKPVPAGDARTP